VFITELGLILLKNTEMWLRHIAQNGGVCMLRSFDILCFIDTNLLKQKKIIKIRINPSPDIMLVIPFHVTLWHTGALLIMSLP